MSTRLFGDAKATAREADPLEQSVQESKERVNATLCCKSA
jgi:hypothetical protein